MKIQVNHKRRYMLILATLCCGGIFSANAQEETFTFQENVMIAMTINISTNVKPAGPLLRCSEDMTGLPLRCQRNGRLHYTPWPRHLHRDVEQPASCASQHGRVALCWPVSF